MRYHHLYINVMPFSKIHALFFTFDFYRPNSLIMTEILYLYVYFRVFLVKLTKL